jgi:hypothetical protein
MKMEEILALIFPLIPIILICLMIRRGWGNDIKITVPTAPLNTVRGIALMIVWTLIALLLVVAIYTYNGGNLRNDSLAEIVLGLLKAASFFVLTGAISVYLACYLKRDK